MALRELATIIGVKDDASSVLQGIDTQIDEIKGGLEGTQDELSGLTDETSSFSYEASKDIGQVVGQTGELEEQTRGFGDRMRSVKDAVTQNWTAITAAVSGAGMALEAFARSQQDMLLTSDNLAYSLGIATDEARDLAYEISDVTMGIEDTYAVLEIGRKQQLKSTYALQEYAGFWSMISDVTGYSAPALAKASASLRAVGIQAGEETEALAAFGFIHQETTSSVMDFMTMLERTGPQIREMGMDINDTAAVLGLMEHGLGMTSRMARQEFRKAANEADGDLVSMLDTLGLSETQFMEYRSAVDASSTVIQDLDEQYIASRTSMQKLQAEVEKTVHLYGAHFMPAIEMLSPVMMGAGAVMGTLAAGQYLVTGALGKALIPALLGGAKAVLGFSVALLTCPITWIIAGVIAVGVAIWQLWKNWDKVSAWFGDRWDWITEKAGLAFDWFKSIDLADVGANIIKGLAGGIESGIKWIKDSIKGVGESIVGGVKSFFGIASPSELMMEYGGFLGAGFQRGIDESMPTRIAAPTTEEIRQKEWQLPNPVSLQGTAEYIGSIVEPVINKLQGIAEYTGLLIKPEVEDLTGSVYYQSVLDDMGAGDIVAPDIGEGMGFFSDVKRIFTPEREQRMAPVAAGAYAPVVNITVNGAGRDADSIANTIDRRLRQTFSTHAERYFSRQRRRR